MIQRANEQARTCRSCREVLSEQEVYRLLASVLFGGTGPWQWLRVAASSWCQQPMTNGWRQLGTGKGWWRRKSTKHTVADFRRCFSLITTYNHTNFPTAAGEVETHKFQLSIVYHLLLFSAGVRRLPRSRFLASAMLSKDSTRTELGKRPIPTRGQGDNLNTITYRRSLLSQKPNSYHRGNRKDKREDNLVSHSLLLFGYSGNIQVASSPGWDRHRTTRPGPRCVPPFFLFHFPLLALTRCFSLALARCFSLALTRCLSPALARCLSLALACCLSLALARRLSLALAPALCASLSLSLSLSLKDIHSRHTLWIQVRCELTADHRVNDNWVLV